MYTSRTGVSAARAARPGWQEASVRDGERSWNQRNGIPQNAFVQQLPASDKGSSATPDFPK